MRTSINKKSDFDFIVLDNEGNAVDMPTSDFTLDLWTWGSKCRFRASSIGGVLKGCKNDGGKLRVYVDNPGFVPGKLVGEWVSYVSSEEYPDGTQRTCRYISDFGIDMVDGDSTTNEQQVLAMMQYIQGESAYEIACEYGFDGTEQEWLDSLALPANEAAAECRTLITELSNAEAERETAEQQRVKAENDRAMAEVERAGAEQRRKYNESARQDNEAKRKDAEEYRIKNENGREFKEELRVKAENKRVDAENLRKTAEDARIASETTRQANEQARETAEVSRAAAEEERKRTHGRLKTAMREYADAESLREEAEAERREAEQYRIEYEQSRQSAEADRLTNERSRVATESQRVTNETARSNAESNRATSETARQEAETARQEAEQGRVTAEQQRADAEVARAEEFATFEGKIAAKEDVANKVTSIGADANNTTFPTTRAVLNSIAEVKNIEVTPEMLSESTKQYINASGGGTITNLADDEDLTSVDNVLKLADKDYSPTSYSGMGRVYLRKNMVDGKNILTQEMLPSANTIYIVQYDYDLNGATINVPANCTLDFQGGSLGNGTVNLGNTRLLNKGLMCNISNITMRYGYPISTYLKSVDDYELNTSVTQTLIDCGIPLIFDYKEINYNRELYVSSTLFINSVGNKKTTLKFNNSRGFVWNKKVFSSGNVIENIAITSLGNCFDLYNSGAADRPHNVFNTSFRNVDATSIEGDCITSGIDNKGASSDNLSFSNLIENVTVRADNGYGIVGLMSNTNHFSKISNFGCSEALFYNCSGIFQSINGCWGECKTFIKCTPRTDGVAVSPSIMLYNSNIESYKGVLIDAPSISVYINLYMRNCSFYITPNEDNVVDYFPIQLGIVRRFEMVNCSTFIYKNGTYADGFCLMKTFGANENIVNSSITYKDTNNYVHSTKVYPSVNSKGVTQATFNKESYNKFDNISVVRNLRYGDLIASDYSIELSGNTHIKLNEGHKMLTLKTPSDLDIEGYICKISYLDINLYDEPLAYYGYTLRLYNASKYSTFRIVHNEGFADRFLCDIGEDVYIRPGEYVDVTKITRGDAPFRYSFVRSYNFSKFFKSGATRPTLYLHKGKQFFDTTLNKPIWWTGSAWVDATGQEV